MACRECQGLEISNAYWAPEKVLQEKYAREFYEKRPVLARLVFVPVAFISGGVKGVLFPVISAIQTLLFTLIAIVKAVRNKPLSPDGPYWQAAGLNFVGLTSAVLFLVLSAYYLKISQASGIYLGGIALSITIHVYRACKGPSKDVPLIER